MEQNTDNPADPDTDNDGIPDKYDVFHNSTRRCANCINRQNSCNTCLSHSRVWIVSHNPRYMLRPNIPTTEHADKRFEIGRASCRERV
jgi:hypothetical protein